MNIVRINRTRMMNAEYTRAGLMPDWQNLVSVYRSGEILSRERMQWMVRVMREAKCGGKTMDQFLSAGRDDREAAEFCRFIWERI